KAKKLYPMQLDLIKLRHAYVRRTMERDFWCRRTEFLEQHGTKGYQAFRERLDDDQRRELTELDRFLEVVLQANEPSLLPERSAQDLTTFARRTYQAPDGAAEPLLSDEEVRFLTIPKGSLDEQERLEIESHVTHTWRFLLEIPWTRELQQVPIIAYGHHEKLDGMGYPRGISGEAIPIQTRMMTIS